MLPIRTLLPLGFTLLAQHASAQDRPVLFADWPSANAVVFAQGAWVEHRGAITPNGSTFEFVLDGLTQQVDPHSIQTELPEGWRLVGAQFSVGVRPEVEAEVADFSSDVASEVADLQATINMRQALQAVYVEELAMLQSNRQLSHHETLLVEDLQEAADFWRNRVKELKYKQLELTEEVRSLEEQVEDLQSELREAHARLSAVSGQIRLRLFAPSTSPGSVTVRYLTQAAQWRPEYDVAIGANGSIVFNRFAAVTQATGNTWEGIPIEFVVGNPMNSLAPPPFERWVLRERQQVVGATSWGYETQLERGGVPAMMDDFEAPLSWEAELQSRPAAPEVFSSDRYRFEPALPPVIAGTGRSERVHIEAFELQGELSYLLLPYASDEAYQLATSDRWAASRLLPGRVQVEAGGAYRGWFDLVLPAPGDTLVIPIGQDPQVRSRRERQADRCTSSAFGGKQKSEQTWVIEVENQHDRAIQARIEERLPLAFRPDITVELLESTGGQFDPVDGKLVWQVELAPGERRTFTVRYRIEYPKGLKISNF